MACFGAIVLRFPASRLIQRLLDQSLRLSLKIWYLLFVTFLVEIRFQKGFERLSSNGLCEVVVHAGVETLFAISLDSRRCLKYKLVYMQLAHGHYAP